MRGPLWPRSQGLEDAEEERDGTAVLVGGDDRSFEVEWVGDEKFQSGSWGMVHDPPTLAALGERAGSALKKSGGAFSSESQEQICLLEIFVDPSASCFSLHPSFCT